MWKESTLESAKKHKKEITQEQCKLVEETKDITELMFKNVSDYHGLGHFILVERFGHYLASKENANVFEVEMASWLHDWGRKGEKERIEKNKNLPHAKISRLKTKEMLLTDLMEEGRINSIEYQQILDIIGRHSDLPSPSMIEAKIIRDSDRLSRMGVLGLNHLIIGGKEQGIPLYKEGKPILRPSSSELKRGVECIVDDINNTIDWENILETKTANNLITQYNLAGVLKDFLKIFNKYHSEAEEKIFVLWVSKEAEKLKQKQNDIINRQSSNKERSKLIEELLSLEKARVFSEENFKEFLKSEKIEIVAKPILNGQS